jgi:phosphoserine / homoserine phosphotransferase
VKQTIVTLDMEGVLTPEIWIAVAEKTGIPELRRTTRDEPDYDILMRGRLDILDRHGLKLSDIQQVIGTLDPLPGAKEFLDELRTLTQVVILSDTFEQFATPLIRKLNWPTLLCHRLVVEDDRILDYQLRIREQKREAVKAFRNMNAVGLAVDDVAQVFARGAGALHDAFRRLAAVGEFEDQRPVEIPLAELADQRGPVDRALAGRQVFVAVAVVVIDVKHAQVAGELVDDGAQVFG